MSEQKNYEVNSKKGVGLRMGYQCARRDHVIVEGGRPKGTKRNTQTGKSWTELVRDIGDCKGCFMLELENQDKEERVEKTRLTQAKQSYRSKWIELGELRVGAGYGKN